ncbi:MAG: hypothetical protein ACREPR_17490 [Brasilonema sp.]
MVPQVLLHTQTIRAPYVNTDGFRFKIYRQGFFSNIGKLFGMQDIEVGEPEFDREFVIQGNKEFQVRRFFANPKIRALIEAQLQICFEAKNDEGFFGTKFPQEVDELHFLVNGVIKDVEQLKSLFYLFAEVLNYLYRI